MLKKVQTIFNNSEKEQKPEVKSYFSSLKTYESVQQLGDDQLEENKM